MKIGVPKEIKDNELRVAIIPDGVKQLTSLGHKVYVEKNAGTGSGISDEQYVKAGAEIVTVAQAWDVDLVVKVKEPQSSEYEYIRQQVIFTFFHLAGSSRVLTETLLARRATAIAYEAIEDENGNLPILEPMSAIAGNMSVLVGAYYLAGFNQGNGMQLGKVLSESFGKVLVVGDGVVGFHAARVANALGAEVVVAGLDEDKWVCRHKKQLREVRYIESKETNIIREIEASDLVVCAVLNRGGKSPYVISEEMVKQMQAGSVIVDVSIDQGGGVETSKPTTHSAPVFSVYGVIHYCVANMPGAYPKTSTVALSKATIPYIVSLAENKLTGLRDAEWLKKSINIYGGRITVEKIAKELGLMDYFSPVSEIKILSK